MPFIITRTQAEGVVARRGVRSLEEARHQAECELIGWQKVTGLKPDAREHVLVARRSSGNEAIFLPDGAWIVMREVDWSELADLADCFPVPWSHRRILDAFNSPGAA